MTWDGRPPGEHADRDGRHWLELHYYDLREQVVAEWKAPDRDGERMWCVGNAWISPDNIHKVYRYLCHCPTPEELRALMGQLEVERANAETLSAMVSAARDGGFAAGITAAAAIPRSWIQKDRDENGRWADHQGHGRLEGIAEEIEALVPTGNPDGAS